MSPALVRLSLDAPLPGMWARDLRGAAGRLRGLTFPC